AVRSELPERARSRRRAARAGGRIAARSHARARPARSGDGHCIGLGRARRPERVVASRREQRMTRALYVGAGTALVAAAGAAYFLHTAHTPEAQLAEHWTTFERYCVDCHNDAERTGGLSLEGLEPDDVAAKAATFEDVVRKLKLGVMPPREEPQP